MQFLEEKIKSTLELSQPANKLGDREPTPVGGVGKCEDIVKQLFRNFQTLIWTNDENLLTQHFTTKNVYMTLQCTLQTCRGIENPHLSAVLSG